MFVALSQDQMDEGTDFPTEHEEPAPIVAKPAPAVTSIARPMVSHSP